MNDKTNIINITRHTYDQMASEYSSMINRLVSDSWVGRFESSLLDRFLLMLKSAKPHVLDIGCGNGKDTEYFRQKSATVVGIDYSSGMLVEARKRITEGILCQMDMRYLGFSDCAFDGVWANGCIYHVPKMDLVQVLGEVMRVLQPLGIFSFNFKLGTGEKLEEKPRSLQRGTRFFAYYSINEMKKFLRQAGFENIKVRHYPQTIFDERIVHVWTRKP